MLMVMPSPTPTTLFPQTEHQEHDAFYLTCSLNVTHNNWNKSVKSVLAQS